MSDSGSRAREITSLQLADTLPFFATALSEVPSPTNRLGVRSGGEGGTTPALAAVINAIVDALAENAATLRSLPHRASPASLPNSGHRVCYNGPVKPIPVASRSAHRILGRSVARLEDPPLLTGQGAFVGDIGFPHQLH